MADDLLSESQVNFIMSSPSPTSKSLTKTPATVVRKALVAGPVLTPYRNGSMVLLSPSRTISDSLTALSRATGQQLEAIWDEVGYSTEDRASQLSDLLVKIKELCEHKIAEEKSVAETFRQTILEAKDEIQHTAAALKLSVDPNLLIEHPESTLTDELATIEAALEGLRTTAVAAKRDLEECRDYIIEAHEALGLEMDPNYRDIESDLTASRRDEFHRKKAEMKDEITTRSSAVIQLVRDCQHLMNDLRIDVEKGGSELDKRAAGSLVRSKDGSFIMSSKFRSATCVGISSIALDELTKRVAELHSEKRRRKVKLQEMGSEIAVLWEKLRVPESEQRAFTESVEGLGLETIQKGEAELKRLHLLKSEMLGKLMEEARATIASLWNQINAASDQRRAFEPYSVPASLFNDGLLDKHEEYIEVLRGRLEQMKPILRLIERLEETVRERMEYEELQKDPERLKQRGAAMTKQLMEEEKMARRIKGLPRLASVLTEKLFEWKDLHSEDFLYQGESYLEVMDRQEEEWQRYKEEEMQRKLRKKQEEKAMGENRAPTFGRTRTNVQQPLGDVGGVGDMKRQQPRNHSHEVVKPTRGLGQKQLSTKF